MLKEAVAGFMRVVEQLEANPTHNLLVCVCKFWYKHGYKLRHYRSMRGVSKRLNVLLNEYGITFLKAANKVRSGYDWGSVLVELPTLNDIVGVPCGTLQNPTNGTSTDSDIRLYCIHALTHTNIHKASLLARGFKMATFQESIEAMEGIEWCKYDHSEGHIELLCKDGYSWKGYKRISGITSWDDVTAFAEEVTHDEEVAQEVVVVPRETKPEVNKMKISPTINKLVESFNSECDSSVHVESYSEVVDEQEVHVVEIADSNSDMLVQYTRQEGHTEYTLTISPDYIHPPASIKDARGLKKAVLVFLASYDM